MEARPEHIPTLKDTMLTRVGKNESNAELNASYSSRGNIEKMKFCKCMYM